MFFLTPKYVKQGKLYIKAAEKKLAYNSDVWSAETCAQMKAHIGSLKSAIGARQKEKVAEAEKAIEEFCGRFCPSGPNAWMTENVEVVLVAIIVALGIRTFIVQPFTIPTSSMSPTLKGITGLRTEQSPPNVAMQAVQWATHGRTWHEVIALDDETVINLEDASDEAKADFTQFAVNSLLRIKRRFLTSTRITTDKGNRYYVSENVPTVRDVFFSEKRTFKKGEPMVRGYSDTGDHVFVNKFIYHFRKPTRGEVIVFLTQNLEYLKNPGPPPRQPSQFYIKRLAGEPGDELFIAPPTLYVNGKPGEERGFQRVGEGTFTAPVDGGYRGYSYGPDYHQAYNLHDPSVKFTVPARHYFPLGDNSYQSSDGRYFGPVPQENMCGSGFLVYWPFMRDGGTHFGLIR
jgi:signal peptidase I